VSFGLTRETDHRWSATTSLDTAPTVEPLVQQPQLGLGRRHEREADGGAEEAGALVGHAARQRGQVASLSGHELMVGALGDVIPWADKRLELRERCVDLPSHRSLLGLFSDDLGR
jgi:hypothetical protein